MHKQTVFVIVVFLLVSCTFPLISSMQNNKGVSAISYNGNTLYVGGSGPGNYTKIQDAIDNTSDGDTVYVYNDSSPYYENVVVDKSINLFGEDGSSTIIDADGSGSVIKIRANWVVINGFSTRNSGSDPYNNDAGIHINTDYNTITNNIITNNHNGIVLTNSDYNTIVGNTVSSNNFNGIAVAASTDNIIKGNTISSNGWGIGILESSGNNIIRGNTIIDNDEHGIFLLLARHTTIIGNDISSNPAGGIWFEENCYNNVIRKNNINNNFYGIAIQYSGDNTITSNSITNSDYYGIAVAGSADNNLLYHNNFIGNEGNAYDECSNYWDGGYPTGGNFWDNYYGNDNDGDGFGDTPYNIPEGDNQDLYPLMNAIPMFIDTGGPYSGVVDGPIHFSCTVFGVYPPYTYYWDFGDGNFSTVQNPNYYYSNPGNYSIILTVTDDQGNNLNETTWVNVEGTNHPPNPPEIDGPVEGKVRRSHDYTFTTTDPDDDNIRLYIDWGDGETEEWIGPYSSGEEVTLSHKWDEEGTYEIKAKAKDTLNEESEWTILEVTMPRNKPIMGLFESRFPRLFNNITYTG